MIELDAWLEFRELNKGQTPSTIGNYRAAVLRFGEWLAVQRVNVPDVTPELMQRYTGAELHGRGLSPSSRRVVVSALRGYYSWLKRRHLVRKSPAEDLPYPAIGRKLPVPLPLADAERLMAQPDLDTFKGVRDLAMMAVLLGCGPRVSGLTGLNEGNLIFTVNQAGIEELTIRFCEKGKHERLVPAPEETRLLVRAYLGHPELELVDRRLPGGDEVLFVNVSNSTVAAHERRGEKRRMTEWSVHRMIRDYGADAGVDAKFLHPHALRHLYGQELAEGDVDLIVRQRLLGHADPKSTEIYSHIAYRKLRKAAIDANPMRRIRSPASGLAGVVKGR